MDELKAKKLLEKIGNRESRGLWFGLDAKAGTVDLGGVFLLDELRAILWYMDNVQIKVPNNN